MTRRRRDNWRASPRSGGGFVLITLIALLTIGGLYFFISNLSPEILRANTQQKTDKALTQARDALLGYAMQYREYQAATGTDSVYGYLPMPDLGEAQNQNGALVNSPCSREGCAKLNPAGLVAGHTYIGRFPWRTLGTEPLRDGHGECLWYIVSGSHRSLSNSGTMNWDTLGQIDVVVAGGTSSDLASAIANRPHDRPVAIIFAPGPPLTGQDRSASAIPGDDVSQCGGNYNPANYIDPSIAAVQGGTSVYFAGNRNVDASVTPVAVAIQGGVEKDGANILHGKCQRSANCTTVANDQGLAVTSDDLFGALRKSSSFRTDINAMLERMATCLRDQIAAGGGLTPVALTGFTPPADKNVGRIPASTCYDDTQNPRGYFSHYSDQIFVAAQTTSPFSVTDTKNTPATADDTTTFCPGVLMFANQRGSGQSRSTATEKSIPANYLEGSNLSGFISTGALNFAGPTQFSPVSALTSATQTASQDIVRCIPSGTNVTVVESPVLTPAQQLVAYDPATSTLTLGKENVTDSTVASSALFGCAWTAEEKTLGSGFRSYFQFTFATLGTSVGNTGFVFSLIDSESNLSLPCGRAGSHLGYSGDNGVTPKIGFPKIGIEFDQSRNTGFPGFSGETSTAVGRNDPCGTSFCGGPGYNSHVAIVYWGHEKINTTDGVNLPDGDDNVHGFPTAASLTSVRRPPKNPDTSPGIEFVNLRTGGQLFHVRVEVNPTRIVDAGAAENSRTNVQTKVWILPDSVTVANQIIAMKNTTRPMAQLYPGFAEKLSDTATVFDVEGQSCALTPCPGDQTCGSDKVCYRQGLRKTRLGFTGSQRTQDQQVTISNISTTWLP